MELEILVTKLETRNQLTRNPSKAPMIKTSTSNKFPKNQSTADSHQGNREKNDSPSNETINALLNFSKSLSVSKSTLMNKVFIVTN